MCRNTVAGCCAVGLCRAAIRTGSQAGSRTLCPGLTENIKPLRLINLTKVHLTLFVMTVISPVYWECGVGSSDSQQIINHLYRYSAFLISDFINISITIFIPTQTVSANEGFTQQTFIRFQFIENKRQTYTYEALYS